MRPICRQFFKKQMKGRAILRCRNESKTYSWLVTQSAPGGFGVRVDSAMESNMMVVPFYDSMIAKIITHGRDRQESIARMRRALDEFVIEGIKTTIPLHKRILNDPDFQKGHVSTLFLERFLSS